MSELVNIRECGTSFADAVAEAMDGATKRMSCSRTAKIRIRLIKRRFAATGEVVCCWCAQPLTRKTATLEHLVPLSAGGTYEDDNLDLACYPCNNRRGTTDWVPLINRQTHGVNK